MDRSAVDPFVVMNAVGLVAFALVGAREGIREEFDLFGIAVAGLATAFAGGVTRDLLVNRVPLALTGPAEIALGTAGMALAVGLSAVAESPADHPVTVAADAVGLAAFATAGAIVATGAGVSGFGVVAVATINAVGGGVLADLLMDRAPFVLHEDFYASCAVLGGNVYWLATVVGVGPGAAAAACALVTLGSRLVAVTWGWGLPTAQALRSAGGRRGDRRRYHR